MRFIKLTEASHPLRFIRVNPRYIVVVKDDNSGSNGAIVCVLSDGVSPYGKNFYYVKETPEEITKLLEELK